MSFLNSGAADKGWNDPPKAFASGGGEASMASEKRSALLTRRVFHDLNAARVVGSSAPAPPFLPSAKLLPNSAPPMQLSPAPPRCEPEAVHSSPSAATAMVITNHGARALETCEELEFCRRVFSLRAAALSSSAIAESEHSQRLEMIGAAIATMADHWSEKTLSSTVKEMLVGIAQAFECQDIQAAKCKLQTLISDNSDQEWQQRYWSVENSFVKIGLTRDYFKVEAEHPKIARLLLGLMGFVYFWGSLGDLLTCLFIEYAGISLLPL